MMIKDNYHGAAKKKSQLLVKVLIGLLQFADGVGRKFLNQGGDIIFNYFGWSFLIIYLFIIVIKRYLLALKLLWI
jgi:hypothetical protein